MELKDLSFKSLCPLPATSKCNGDGCSLWWERMCVMDKF